MNRKNLFKILIAVSFTLANCGGGSSSPAGDDLVATISDTPPTDEMTGEWLLTRTVTDSDCQYQDVNVGDESEMGWQVNSDSTCSYYSTTSTFSISAYTYWDEESSETDCKADADNMVYYSNYTYIYDGDENVTATDETEEDQETTVDSSESCTKTGQIKYQLQFVDGAWSGVYNYDIAYSSACEDVPDMETETCSMSGTFSSIPMGDTVTIDLLAVTDGILDFSVSDPHDYTYPTVYAESNPDEILEQFQGSGEGKVIAMPGETTTYILEARHYEDDGSYTVVKSSSVTVTIDSSTETDTSTSTSTTSTGTTTATSTSTSTTTTTSTTTVTSTATATETDEDESTASLTVSGFEIVSDNPHHLGGAVSVQITVTNTGEVTGFLPKLTLTPMTRGDGSGGSVTTLKPASVMPFINNPNATVLDGESFTLAAGESFTYTFGFTLLSTLELDGRYMLRLTFVRESDGSAVSLHREDDAFLFGSIKIE